MSTGVVSQGQDMGRKAKGKGVQVRLDAELVRMAKWVADTKGKTVQDYIHDKLFRVVLAEFHKSIGRSVPDPDQGQEGVEA